jgi:hypothetical protein
MAKKRTIFTNKNSSYAIVVLKFALMILSVAGFLPAQRTQSIHAAEIDTISGKLDDGTPYTVQKPTPWNGTIVLDLDGAGFGAAPGAAPSAAVPAAAKAVGGKNAWLTGHGYAVGGTSRNIVGYNFKKAIENLVAVRRIFAEKYGMPKRTLTIGGSRGGFVSRLAMEFEPDIFDGALVTAGGGLGEVATLNRVLDAVWTLKQLVNPNASLKLVNLTDQSSEDAALKGLLSEVDSTPQGRARLALAAGLEQFASWTDRNSPEPAPSDYEAQYKQILSSFQFANPAVVRMGVEAVAKGNVSWNNGVDYTAQLNKSGKLEFVKAMYKKAGLSLEEDLQTLAKAPRISANPEALGIAEGLMTYTGKIKGPIMNVKNTGDPIDPTSCDVAYEQTLKRAGTQGFLKTAFVHSPGHGGANDLELIAGFVVLIKRLETGKWVSTSPEDMNKLAAKIGAESPEIFSGVTARFIKHKPNEPVRTWDGSNRSTYRK